MHSSREAITVISDLTGHDRTKSQADRKCAEIGLLATREEQHLTRLDLDRAAD